MTNTTDSLAALHNKTTASLLLLYRRNTGGNQNSTSFYFFTFQTMPAHLLDSVLCAIRLHLPPPLSRADPACRFAPFTSTQWQEQNSTLSPTAKTIRRRPPRALDASVACVTQSIWSLLLVSVCDTTTTTTSSSSHTPLLLHMSAVAKQAG